MVRVPLAPPEHLRTHCFTGLGLLKVPARPISREILAARLNLEGRLSGPDPPGVYADDSRRRTPDEVRRKRSETATPGL